MSLIRIDVSNMPQQHWAIEFKPEGNPYEPVRGLTEVAKINAQSVSSFEALTQSQPDISLKELLFQNSGSLKVQLSQIVMHLSTEWKSVIRAQIDRLLNEEDWEEDSSTINESSFKTFLRFIIFASPSRYPSLGVSPSGNLLAAWKHEDKSVMAEFAPNDRSTATFMWNGTRSKEAVAWRGHVADLKLFIERNGILDCIKGEN